MNNRRYAISEAAGIAAIYSAAVLLHFVCPLTDCSTLAVIFGAVNESVWEHVKIFTAAYCGYALLQLLWIRVPFRRYLVGKCCGLYLLGGGIIGFFYLYTGIAGAPVVWLDVLSSAMMVALAQLISYRITLSRRAEECFAPALMLLLLYYLMFFSFTAFPPRAGLFRDPITGGYGLEGIKAPVFAEKVRENSFYFPMGSKGDNHIWYTYRV